MGRTPFLIASSYPGTVPLLRYLASKGADTKVTNRFGGGAVVRAVRSSDVEVLRCLLDLGLEPSAGSTPGAVLALAARRQYRPSLDLLMSRMSPAPKDISGVTASDHDTLSIMKLLIEKGADPNLADKDGETPLDWAIHRRDQSRIDLLNN